MPPANHTEIGIALQKGIWEEIPKYQGERSSTASAVEGYLSITEFLPSEESQSHSERRANHTKVYLN